RSRCANSAPMRPILSQTPDRMVWISAGVFSGKAAVSCARAIAFSRNSGLMVRMNQPDALASASNGTIRKLRSRPTAIAPAAASPARLARRRSFRFSVLMTSFVSQALPPTPFIPAQAGIQGQAYRVSSQNWVPAFAGTNGRDRTSEIDDDLAEHLAALEALEPLLEIGERHFGVDDGVDAGRHLGQRVADVLDTAAERTEDLVLLLEQLHQVDGHGRAGRGAAGDQPAAALEHQQRAVEAFAADMLEHDVDALLGGELARHALEAVFLVIDDVIGAERPGFLGLVVVADGGDDGAAERLRHLDRHRADAGASGVNEDGLAGLELGVVEQHVLGGAEGDRRAGGVAQRDAVRHRHDQPRRHVDEVAGEAVNVEAEHAADVFAQIVAALAAVDAFAAGHGAVHDDLLPRLELADAWPDRGDLAGGLGADDEGQLPLGEGHAAEAPEVEVIEADRLDTDLHLVLGGRGRIRHLGQFELAVADQSQCAHGDSGMRLLKRHAGARHPSRL